MKTNKGKKQSLLPPLLALKFVMIFLLLSSRIFSQSIKKAEYFLDTDPGFGNGYKLTITPSADINNISISTNVEGLSNGIHQLFIRAEDENAVWSITNIRSFSKETLNNSILDIVKLEYFIDTDPGISNGHNIPITRSPNVTATYIPIDISSLSDGFHSLFLRGMDSNEKWSITNIRNFVKQSNGTINNIIRLESFIDNDPGFGKGSPVSVPIPSTNVTSSLSTDVSSLSSGFHNIYIRGMDEMRRWSITHVRTFYLEKLENTTLNIVKLEYFIDNDPGFGKANQINVAIPSPNVTASLETDISSLSSGFHYLYIRAKDETGKWSIRNIRSFFICKPEVDLDVSIVRIEYFIDTDPGKGNGQSGSLGSGGGSSSISADLSGLGGGFHTIYIRVQNSDGSWSTTQSYNFYIEKVDNTVSDLLKLEYSLDNEPGFGKGTPIPLLTSGTNVIAKLAIDISGLSIGTHNIYIRGKNKSGKWSITNIRSFLIQGTTTMPYIVKLEYFLDTDPGQGKGVDVPVLYPDTNVTIAPAIAIDLNNVSVGYHLIYFRAMDSEGKWSIRHIRAFIKEPIIPSLPNIVRMEFFIDTDPGIGKAQSIPVLSPGTDIINSVTADISTLSDGCHYIFIRAMDINGVWSITNKRYFLKETTNNLVKLEYFIDTDPGFGKAVKVDIPYPGTDVTSSIYADIDTLADGYHTLYIRGMVSDGVWSISSKRTFIKESFNNKQDLNIVKMEYFVDNDPGIGYGNDIPIPIIGSNVTTSLAFDITPFTTNANHYLYIRAMDSEGKWCVTNNRIFFKDACNGAEPNFSTNAVCFGYPTSFTNLTLGSDNETKFKWYIYDANLAVSTSKVDFSYTFTTPGDHIVKLITTNGKPCNTDSVFKTVKVYNLPNPQITASGPTAFCPGGSVELRITNYESGNKYQWLKDGALLNAATYSSYTVFTAGSYTLNLTDKNGCTYDSQPVTVRILTQPSANISVVGNSNICQGDTALMEANAGENYVYKWLNNDIIITSATKDYLLTTQGGYYKVVITNSCGTATSQAITININSLPEAIISHTASLNVCLGETVTLTSNTSTGFTYQWLKDNTILTEATSSAYVVKISGKYSVIVTNSNQCSKQSAADTVTYYTAPTATITAQGSLSLCQGNSLVLLANNGIGYSYKWMKNGVIIPSTTTASYTANSAGGYKVAITNKCWTTTSDQITIAINPLPTVNISPTGPINICTDANVILHANSAQANSYQWIKETDIIAGATSSTFAAAQTGNYSVKVYNSSNCYANSPIVSVIANPLPDAPISLIGNNKICEGDSVTLFTNKLNDMTYQWQKDNVNIPGNSNFSYTAKMTGNFRVILNNKYNCQSVSASINIIAVKPTEASITSDGNNLLCPDKTIVLRANNEAGLTYQWRKDNDDIQNGTNSIFSANTAGKYSVKIIKDNVCPSNSNDIIIISSELPSIILQPISQTKEVGQSAAFNIIALSQTSFSYQWLKIIME